MKTPSETPEYANFSNILRGVLKVSKPEMDRRLAEEKRSKTSTASRVPVARAKRG